VLQITGVGRGLCRPNITQMEVTVSAAHVRISRVVTYLRDCKTPNYVTTVVERQSAHRRRVHLQKFGPLSVHNSVHTSADITMIVHRSVLITRRRK